MHSSISDEVVKNLDKLANSKQTRKFREAFHNLSTDHKNEYIRHVKAKPQGSLAMSGILNSLDKKDALSIFIQLPQEFAFNTLDCINRQSPLFKTLLGALNKNQYIEHVKAKPQGSSAMSGILNALDNKDALSIFNQLPQEFAFNTLDCINPTFTLFKTLFSKLDQLDKDNYIKHVKEKPKGSSAMSGILNALDKKDALSIFIQLPQEFAFNTLDCINPTFTLFKTLFSKLDQLDKDNYIKHVKEKPKGSSAMSGILNALDNKDALSIFIQLPQEFAFNTLDCINPTFTLFKTLFSKLDQLDKDNYIKHVKEKPKGSSAMSGILNALDNKDALSIFIQLPQEFAFNTLDCINPTSTLFKTLFGALNKNQYIEHVKAKPQGSSAMSGILNSLDKKDALSIFIQLPQEFAFNTLDCINPTFTLFKTLFGKLNIQQKEDYRVHLKTKSTAKAKLVLSNFYSSNKESSSNLSTKNSNKPLVQNRDDLSAAHFSPIPHAFEETVVEHTFDTRLELSSDKEDQSCSQIVPPFEGFAEFHNQFRNIVLENSTTSNPSYGLENR